MSTQSRHDIDYSARGGVADLTAAFAGVLLLVGAGFDILQGLSAVIDDDLYAAGTEYLYRLDMTTWGVVHLVLGVLSAIVAIGILRRASWGQVTGMIVAGLAILTNFAAIPIYPAWSIVLIAWYGLVIWALSAQMRHYR